MARPKTRHWGLIWLLFRAEKFSTELLPKYLSPSSPPVTSSHPKKVQVRKDKRLNITGGRWFLPVNLNLNGQSYPIHVSEEVTVPCGINEVHPSKPEHRNYQNEIRSSRRRRKNNRQTNSPCLSRTPNTDFFLSISNKKKIHCKPR